jgi:2-C-methyl-D-erythritol 4-phosphate cytidylyltransferase
VDGDGVIDTYDLALAKRGMLKGFANKYDEESADIDGNGEGHNVLRSDYRIVQTPQTFDIQLAKRAFQQPYSDTFTDDASVVEAMGNSVAMVDGNRENIKLTTPYDLMIAEQLVTTP